MFKPTLPSSSGDKSQDSSQANLRCHLAFSLQEIGGKVGFIILVCLGILLSASFVEALQAPSHASKLNWMTSYEEAIKQSKEQKKPLLLFFTGSEWCGWCHKLDNEVFSTTEFADAVGDHFIFVIVDHPLKNLPAQNKDLEKRFGVTTWPTLFLLDENQQQIGTSGYRPGGAKAYAEHLKQMVNEFKDYRKSISLLNHSTGTAEELKLLYNKAKELCRYEDANRIVKAGLQCNNNQFFLLEKFRSLADDRQMHASEAISLRQQLLTQDPNNEFKTHYEVAVIEFENFAEEMEREKYAPEIAVAPLVGYIERFGDQDHENTWRLHLIISQVFLDKEKFKEALKHAHAAHATAPEDIQPNLQTYIHNIQTHLANL